VWLEGAGVKPFQIMYSSSLSSRPTRFVSDAKFHS
jgi:hypothetical protein